MRKLTTALGLFGLLAMPLVAGLTRAQVEKSATSQQTEPSVWMKQKLAASQNVLGGLTKGEYDTIAKNANSMLAIGYLEKWVRADIPEYRKLLKDFEFANKALVEAARDKNLDKATIAYVQLTFSCVDCHKIVRAEMR
jgi:hypothetical protein